MTTITNKERQAAIAKVLEDTFTPQIAEFKEKLRAYFIEQNEQKHPTFAAVAKNDSVRPYLERLTNLVPKFGFENSQGNASEGYMYWPPYTSITGVIDSGSIIDTDENSYRHRVGISDLFVAASLSCTVSDELSEEYRALARKRQDAREQLETVFYSYTNREKFEADFPELAKWLPAKPIKAKGTALSVPVADFRAKLKELGIPAQE